MCCGIKIVRKSLILLYQKYQYLTIIYLFVWLNNNKPMTIDYRNTKLIDISGHRQDVKKQVTHN